MKFRQFGFKSIFPLGGISPVRDTWADQDFATVVAAPDGSGDYEDIEDALNALPSSGGLVSLKQGTFDAYEIEIPPNASLVGCGPSTILKHLDLPSIIGKPILYSTAALRDVSFSNFTIDGGDINNSAGVKFTNIDRVVFHNIQIKNCASHGFELIGDHTYVLTCIIRDCLNGILLNGDRNRINGNSIYDNSGWGIQELASSDFNIITENNFENNALGAMDLVGANDEIGHNIEE